MSQIIPFSSVAKDSAGATLAMRLVLKAQSIRDVKGTFIRKNRNNLAVINESLGIAFIDCDKFRGTGADFVCLVKKPVEKVK